VAIEYCIKMIINNQLNQQDFDFKGKAVLVSSSEESDSQVNSERPGSLVSLDNVDNRNTLKMWYQSFTEN